MKKQRKNSTSASALQVTLVIALLSISAILLASSFKAAPSAPATPAAVWFVNSTTGNDSNDCLSPATACQTIQAAVNKASAGDTINVAAGTYTENVSITKSLSMNGAQAGIDARGRVGAESVVIPATPSIGTFTIAFNGLISVDGFTFSGGT